MKYTLLAILLLSLGFASCKKEEITPDPVPFQRVQIPFTGNWQRQFEAGPGNTHTSQYAIYQDSIRYVLAGPIGKANYLLLRDTFLLDKNRFIGHTSANQHYLIFVKEFAGDSISIYKQEIESISEGLSLDVPDDSTGANFGWGTYYRK